MSPFCLDFIFDLLGYIWTGFIPQGPIPSHACDQNILTEVQSENWQKGLQHNKSSNSLQNKA
jgi:hypothetical protein